uniref:Aldehyde dehydrogenase 4 family member A1 n=1 Tax=Cyanoderma ruficeps TaxID=181631 RepID=A0A8C3NWZ5_9PASS
LLPCPRRRWQHSSAIQVTNEPILEFKPGSPERAALQKALADLRGKTEDIPCVIGGEEVWTPTVRYQLSPFNHAHKVAKYCYASKELINKAINAALAARKEWDLKPVQDRAQIFLKAADLLSGPRRAEVLAKTMVGQVRAAGGAGGAARGIFGFLVPQGNVVLWKPSDTALLSSYAVYKVLLEAGLPPNVVQFVPSDGPEFGDTVTGSEHFCGLNFTGSVPLWDPGTLPQIPVGIPIPNPCRDPRDPIMREEIFGPILTVFVYPEDRYEEVLELIDTTTPYGLTGAIFAQDKGVIEQSRRLLRHAAGNFYINDKSTGAVVAQQPFGGSRISGTNDKPGGPHYILRWTSPQAIKETHVPLRDWRYAYMG